MRFVSVTESSVIVFALVRASSLCLRGSRVKWRSGLGFDDGASLPTVMQ